MDAIDRWDVDTHAKCEAFKEEGGAQRAFGFIAVAAVDVHCGGRVDMCMFVCMYERTYVCMDLNAHFYTSIQPPRQAHRPGSCCVATVMPLLSFVICVPALPTSPLRD